MVFSRQEGLEMLKLISHAILKQKNKKEKQNTKCGVCVYV